MTGQRLILLLAVLAWYGYCDHRQIPVWHDEPALWINANQIAPLKPRPLNNLAKLYFAQSRDQEWPAMEDRVSVLLALRGRR